MRRSLGNLKTLHTCKQKPKWSFPFIVASNFTSFAVFWIHDCVCRYSVSLCVFTVYFTCSRVLKLSVWIMTMHVVIQSRSHTSILRLIVLFIYHADDLNTRSRSNVLFPIWFAYLKLCQIPRKIMHEYVRNITTPVIRQFKPVHSRCYECIGFCSKNTWVM